MEPRSQASPEQFSLTEYMESHGDLSKPDAGAQGSGVENWKKSPSEEPMDPTGVKLGPAKADGNNQFVEEIASTPIQSPSISPSSSPPPLALPTRPSQPPALASSAPPLTLPCSPRSTDGRVKASRRSSATTQNRRLQLRAHRNRRQTLFDRATSEFVAIEQRRLQLEEARERRWHQMKMEQLRLESERIREQNELFRLLGVVGERLLDILTQRRLLPPTE